MKKFSFKPILPLSFLVLLSACSKTVNRYEGAQSNSNNDERSALASARPSIALNELNESLQNFNNIFIDKILSKDDYIATFNPSFQQDLVTLDSPISEVESEELVTKMKKRARRAQLNTSPWETTKRSYDPCKSRQVRWMVQGRESLLEGNSSLALTTDQLTKCNEIVNNSANKPFIDAYQRTVLHKAKFKFDVALFVEGYADNFLLESRVKAAKESVGIQEAEEVSPTEKSLTQFKDLVSVYDSVEKALLEGATVDKATRKITYENVDHENVLKVCAEAEQRLEQILTEDPDNKLVRKIRIELGDFITDLKIVMQGFLERSPKV